jgi:DNA repair protein RecO (recombination protein O)
MAVLYKTQGFVVKKSDSGETDRIFTIFSREFGKIKIKGKAIRKITSKLRSGVDTFCILEIEFIQGKNQKTLTDAVVLERFSNIKKDQAKIKFGRRMLSSLDSLAGEEQKEEKIWNLTKEVFGKLDQCNLSIAHYSLLYYYFLWNLFSIFGFHPQLFRCAVCEKELDPAIICFSPDEGGTVCKLCVSKARDIKKVNADLVKILRLILKKDWDILPKLKLQPFSQRMLQDISDNYYRHLLSVHLSGERLKEKAL